MASLTWHDAVQKLPILQRWINQLFRHTFPPLGFDHRAVNATCSSMIVATASCAHSPYPAVGLRAALKPN
jgi:hypothetical protein